jgi:hypothetical protein
VGKNKTKALKKMENFPKEYGLCGTHTYKESIIGIPGIKKHLKLSS